MTRNDLQPKEKSRREMESHEVMHPLAAMQRQMNRLFEDFFGDFGLRPLEGWTGLQGEYVPSVNVRESENEIEVTAELPGLEENDVEVILEENHLTLRGEKKMQKEEKKGSYYHRESSYGTFQRTISLETPVDEEKVQASFRNGVLSIRLPKTEPEKTRRKKIEIKHG